VGDYDPLVTDIRINPTGNFDSNAGTPPSCTFPFRVKID
jgi:hypothetical protein